MVQNLHTFFLSKEIKRSPNIKPQTKVFSRASNLNIRQAKNNIGSRLELCSWPPAVLKSNIRLSPNSTLVNNYSGRRLCLPYTLVANSAPFAGETMWANIWRLADFTGRLLYFLFVWKCIVFYSQTQSDDLNLYITSAQICRSRHSGKPTWETDLGNRVNPVVGTRPLGRHEVGSVRFSCLTCSDQIIAQYLEYN